MHSPKDRKTSPERFSRNPNLPNPKLGQRTYGCSGRSARGRVLAGSGEIGCQQNYSPQKRMTTVPSKASKERRKNDPKEAQTSGILFKPTEELNHLLTGGFFSVYDWCITALSAGRERALFPAADHWTDAFCCCKPFHARLVREHAKSIQTDGKTTHLSNPKPGHTMGRKGRGGAQRRRGAGRGSVGRDAVGSIQPGKNAPISPPANRESSQD